MLRWSTRSGEEEQSREQQRRAGDKQRGARDLCGHCAIGLKAVASGCAGVDLHDDAGSSTLRGSCTLRSTWNLNKSSFDDATGASWSGEIGKWMQKGMKIKLIRGSSGAKASLFNSNENYDERMHLRCDPFG